jgi:hypothetical protein
MRAIFLGNRGRYDILVYLTGASEWPMKMWRICTAAAIAAGMLLVSSAAIAQTTQPANLPLEYRANQAFNQGRYVVALPLLQELAGDLIDQPDKLGPVEERVRVCKRAIEAAKKMQADPAAASSGTVPQDGPRVPHVVPAAGAFLDLPIKQLGNFDYDAEHGGNIPPDVVQLTGCKLRTRGYMIPLDQAENIAEFALVPSLFACCFGQPPQIQHTLVVHLPPGKAVSYFPDELQIEGTLRVEEKRDDGFIVSIFDVDATSVKPAPK